MAITICTYNIEWFDDHFTATNGLKAGAEHSKKFEAVRDAMQTVDADVYGIVEAPNTTTTTGQRSTVAALENFAAAMGLRTTKAMTGYISAGRQELAFLFDPAMVSITHAPGGKSDSKKNPKFNGVFLYDTDEDRIKEEYKFYRPPLEAKITVKANGKVFYAILVHPKSKGIFNSVDVLHFERENRRNRRKLFAECTWIRRRVDEWLDKDRDVVVLGDINDGPGMDAEEFQFARSAVENIMGDLFEPDRVLRNHAGRPKWTNYGWEPSSTSFKDRITEDYIHVLIDHVLVSKGLEPSGEKAHVVWNPFRVDVAKPIKQQLLDASDHFPVSLRIA